MAKTMTCIAILDNRIQKDNLCDCIKILGGKPEVYQGVVRVNVEYPSGLADKLVRLFENYWRHEIVVTGQ